MRGEFGLALAEAENLVRDADINRRMPERSIGYRMLVDRI
jgi:hypothetical protein